MKRLFFIIGYVLMLCISTDSTAQCNYQRTAGSLVAPFFIPLPYGSIEPTGWLREWSETAKDGLILNNVALTKQWQDSQSKDWHASKIPYWLHDIKFFKDSWLYGQPPFTLSEQTAYWIDGMMRLGLATHDSAMLNRAFADVDSVVKNNYLNPGGWSSSVYQRAVLAYYLGSSDTTAINYLNRFFRTTVFNGFSGAEIWSKFLRPERMACLHATEPRDIVQTETMFETFSFTGDSMVLRRALQSLKPYEKHFVQFWNGAYSDTSNLISPNGSVYKMYGVSYNEMAKLWAIAYLYNGNKKYLQASENAYKLLDSLHIMPHGVNSGMENIAGVDATIPTETCDVSDYIHSLVWMYRITGKASYGDRIEKAFFNAVPAAVSYDYKQHVYFQAPNNLRTDDKWGFAELHDPLCCTGNQARLLPNYLLHMFMVTNNGGLAFNLYGPCKVSALVGNKTPAQLEVTTNYPFEETINIKVVPTKSTQFPMYFRIPNWSSNPSVMINGVLEPLKQNDQGFIVVDRKWEKDDFIVLNFPRTASIIRSLTKSNNSYGSTQVTSHLKAISGTPYATVEYGPLLFALKVNANTAYNYALTLDKLEVNKKEYLGTWSWKNPPIEITALALPFNWSNAPDLPISKITPTREVHKLVLVPYGCTHGTRISMFPYVQKK